MLISVLRSCHFFGRLWKSEVREPTPAKMGLLQAKKGSSRQKKADLKKFFFIIIIWSINWTA